MEDNFTNGHFIKAYCKSCYKKQIVEKKFSSDTTGWHFFYEEDYQFIKNSSTVIIRSGKRSINCANNTNSLLSKLICDCRVPSLL